MSLSPAKQAEWILTRRRILNRWVVLCEGTIRTNRPAHSEDGSLPSHRFTERSYNRESKFQDAAFYLACTPERWRDSKPRFFNCGGRSQVVETYNELLLQHLAAPKKSYLNPARLVAIVDADLQAAATPDACPYTDTEHARAAILAGVLPEPEVHGKTWVTRMVHKECHFLLPPSNVAFSNSRITPHLGEQPLELSLAHIEIAQRLHHTHPHHETDHIHNLPLIQGRLQQAASPRLATDNLDAISTSWINAYNPEGPEAHLLAQTLLTITKAKPVWKEVKPTPSAGFEHPNHIFREQLARAIAKEISKVRPDQHPIAALFAYLRKTAGLEPLF